MQALSSTGLPSGNGPFYTALADQTASTTATAGGAGDMRVACRSFRALVFIKTYVVGTATVGPIVSLICADNAGLTTNLTVVSSVTGENVASGTEVQSLFLFGQTPLIGGRQFVGIKVTLNGTATIAFDCVIEGT